MRRKIEHEEEAGGSPELSAFAGEEARRYVERHRKLAGFQFGAVLKDIKAFGISGNYLEIGAGPGILAAMIAESIPQVTITAVDLSPDMVAIAEEHIKERKLQDTVRCLIGDASDEKMMAGLGKFDIVYSAFTLHGWSEPEKIIGNLWNAMKDNGILYLFDFKRVWWLYYLPLNSRDIRAVRASYVSREVKAILREANITQYRVRTPFPFFWQSLVARK